MRVKIFADIITKHGGQKTEDEIFSADTIARGLQTQTLGRRIVYYRRIGSTNDAAKQLADAGGPEGTVVIADEQTAGRGRLGRAWLAPPRSSILMSLILRPTLAPHQASRVTMAIAVGTCQAIRAATGLGAQIKWPNDLLVGGKKFAGILSESGIVGNTLEYIVVGIGVNVNFSVANAYPVSLRNRVLENATTIADALGKSFPRAPLTQTILANIENYYMRLRAGENLRVEYSDRLATLNQPVRAQTPAGVAAGIAESVDENGALLVRRADGALIELIAGDVTLIKSAGG